MNSVNLNSIQDFSQIHEQKVEQNFTANENPSKDFFSMLSDNLNKAGERNPPESAKKDSAPVQREKIPAEKSDSPKEIPEKAISLEKKSSASDERKAVRDEKKDGKKIASKDEGAEKKSRGKNLKADEVLQGALVADAQGAKNLSAKRTEDLEGKKIARADVEKKSQKNFNPTMENVSRDFSEEKSDLENLRVGLSKKNFISEAASSALEKDSLGENADAEIISALQFSASQIQNFENQNSSNANLKNADNFSSKNAISAKSKRESRIGVIEVKDFRTNVEGAQGEAKDFKKDFVRAVQNDSQGLTIELGAQSERNMLSLDSQSAAADGSNFQAMLKNQITQNATEFVRAGNIVLRDNDSGSINLVLHPESLGNVKIGLELSGKIVTGHIVVASREAFNAFGDGADVLRNAFIQSGFEDARFDVSFAGSEMQFAQQNHGGQDDGSSKRQGRKIYGDFVEENISVGFENADNNIGNVLASNYSIDVVA